MEYLQDSKESFSHNEDLGFSEEPPEDRLTEERYAEFETFIARAEKNRDLKFFAKSLRETIINYAASVDKLNALQKLDSKKDDLERADHDRKTLHDGLIDKLNIISRGFSERGWDNRWRKNIGMQREEVTEWALGIAKRLVRK